MKCPFCGRDNTRVIDSRPSDDNNAIRRRRVCDVCGKRFTTYEKVSANEITGLIDEVETDIFSREEKEIPSSVIGELVMNKLKDLDAVAYVRFASVYREFKDVNTFFDELRKAVEKKKK